MAARKKVNNEVASPSRCLIVNNKQMGTFKIYIPSDARVTFGPLVPGIKEKYSMGGDSNHGTALRVYQGQNQIALFRDVNSFRDSEIKIQRLMVRKKGSTTWETSDKQTDFKQNEQKEYNWIDQENDSPF